LKIIEKINKSELTIVALGDSLTYGWMVSKGYLCQLREILTKEYPDKKFNIINSGNPGDTARCGLYRLTNDVIRHNPDIVLVQFALNDAFNEVSIDEFKNNIKSIVEEIINKTSAIPVMMTSSIVLNSEDNRYVEKYYNIIENCGNELNIPVVKVHDYWNKKIREGIKITSLLQTDGVHPNTAGHTLMAESINSVL